MRRQERRRLAGSYNLSSTATWRKDPTTHPSLRFVISYAIGRQLASSFLSWPCMPAGSSQSRLAAHLRSACSLLPVVYSARPEAGRTPQPCGKTHCWCARRGKCSCAATRHCSTVSRRMRRCEAVAACCPGIKRRFFTYMPCFISKRRPSYL